jgi:hypothetical protein
MTKTNNNHTVLLFNEEIGLIEKVVRYSLKVGFCNLTNERELVLVNDIKEKILPIKSNINPRHTMEPDFFRVFGSGWVLKTQTRNPNP